MKVILPYVGLIELMPAITAYLTNDQQWKCRRGNCPGDIVQVDIIQRYMVQVDTVQVEIDQRILPMGILSSDIL